MDHEVEDDIDIHRPGGEGRESLGLEIAHAFGEREGRLHRRVVELHVTHGENEVSIISHGDELGGLLESGGDGFLHHDVAALFEEHPGGGAMVDRRSRDHHCVGLARSFDRG